MLEPPLDEADPAFECIGGTFWVRKNDDEVGVRARTRLLELSALFVGDALHAVVEPLVANRREGGGCGGRVSLRALDWTVTNYAKRRSVTLLRLDARGSPSRWFSIHHEYKAWLRVWRRKLFDPFARRSRVFFQGSEDTWVASTPAQLNFVYFALEFGILEWVRRNLGEIEKDNNRALRRTKEDKKRKRTALSAAPPVSVMIVDRPVRVTWE